MLQKLIRRFTIRRHYWRNVGFDELSELYTNIAFRGMAQSIVGIFVPIYLYQLGHSISVVLLFTAGIYLVWQVASFLAAWLIAWIGPKHAILWSQILIAIALGMLVTLKFIHWPLWSIALVMGVSNAVFFVSFYVDFSKVKHSDHGGKEVGWMYAMQRAGVALGPILGGVVAYFFGAEYIFLACVLLLLFGTVPLFFTAEPVRTHQRISFNELSLREIRYDLVSWSAMAIETMATTVIWPFFIAVFVFGENPYLKLGVVISASVVVTLFASRSIGLVIDKKKGRSLLRIGAVLNALLHLYRPFVPNFSGTFVVSVLNEVVTPMYRMPLTKGLFDAADDLPGRRIVYCATIESVSCFVRAVFFLILAIIAAGAPRQALVVGFVLGAAASLLIMAERFRALNTR